ncbi:hypothetical protein pipiens_005010, partial [Culex pipiens pipiens]
MSVLDWDLEVNMTLPFASWDRTKWVLSVRNDGTPSYGFKKALPTKILVHGWVGDSESEVIGPLAQEYLKKGDVNVIGVSWTKGAKTIYGFARKRVGAVGDLVAKLVGRLLDLGQVVDQIGMIGHSLGAHVVGLAGKKTPKKVAYIVGLDPAQPYFLVSKPQGRLADTDAQYVEVLHTNGDWLAFFTNIGTADFYPNGGKKQPGCGRLFYRRCSHKRAVTIFKESLMAKGYYANRCPSLDKLNQKCNLGRVEFGEVDVHPLMSKPRGVYYFETNANPPFLKASHEMPLYPEDDLALRTTSNGSIAPFPFTWDREKFMLLPNKEGKLELFDRNRVYQIRLESRSYDAAQDVHFLFFSRTNGGKPVKLRFDQVGDLPSHGFRKELPTKVLIHGWMGSSESDVVEPLARAYLEKGDVNVIGVVWAKISGSLNYPDVASQVPMVGELVAKMVDKLLELGQVGDQIGMVGHSLGAHVAGIAGKKTRQKVAYIVGLDPADFLFSLDEPQGRLSSEDAQYVEVIHSNGGNLAMFENIGTADFYPNGGRSQPGCGLDFLWICSHGRAVTYFKESLMARGYFANRCSDLNNLHSKCSLGRVEFGEIHVHPLAKKPRGVYYFETNEKEPYLRTIAQEVPRRQ